MQQLLTRVGGPKAQMKPQVESALTQLAQDLVGQALSFGCSMARRRQAPGAAAEDLVLQPADLAAFLEQTWYGLLGLFSILFFSLQMLANDFFICLLVCVHSRVMHLCNGVYWIDALCLTQCGHCLACMSHGHV